MSSIDKAREAVRAAAARFVENAKSIANVNLDGSIKSLILVSSVMQRYHAMYQKAKAANDPDLDRFVQQIAVEATAYVGSLFTNGYGAHWQANDKGIFLELAGTQVPIQQLMMEEVQTGRPQSILILGTMDKLQQQSKPTPEEMPNDRIAAEQASRASVAVQDVRSMLKQELDFSPESLAHVDKALQRLKGMAEMAADHRDQIVRASKEKYGAYIGEVMLKALADSAWRDVKSSDKQYRSIGFGPRYAMPEHMVEAVLAGKTLHMGERNPPATAVEFFAVCRQMHAEAAEAKGKEDGAGYLLKNVERFASEAVGLAREHGIELDFTLFSLEPLDRYIAALRQTLPAQAESEAQQMERGNAVMKLGAYLGEVLRRMHGGAWERAEPAPKLKQRSMSLFPMRIVGSLLQGEPAAATAHVKVVSAQHYYQELRPMFMDQLEARMCGEGKKLGNLAAAMGKDSSLNGQLLEFLESALIDAYMNHKVLLDFSEESLKLVDKLLDGLRAKLPAEGEKASVPGLDRLTLIYWYGTYAGEVMRRQLGGEWTNEATNNEKILHLNVGGNRFYVLSKVKKLLDNGLEDSVGFMLHSVKYLVEKGELKLQ